jgi:hypothetical protein
MEKNQGLPMPGEEREARPGCCVCVLGALPFLLSVEWAKDHPPLGALYWCFDWQQKGALNQDFLAKVVLILAQPSLHPAPLSGSTRLLTSTLAQPCSGCGQPSGDNTDLEVPSWKSKMCG